MGMIQKVLWWILYYAITWFCLLIVWGVISETGIFPKALIGFLIFPLFLVPAWYATRKVKQKVRKKEMEQRVGQSSQPRQAVVPSPSPQNLTFPPHTHDSVIPQAPVIQENENRPTTIEDPATVSSASTSLPDLNSATVEDLTKLSGINRILAMKIISTKDKDGTYCSFDDLFSRIQLTPQAKEELLSHFSITQVSEGRFIDF